MYYKYKVKSPAIAQILTSLIKHKKKELCVTYSQEQEDDYIGPRTVFSYGEQVLGNGKYKDIIGNYFSFACPKSWIGQNGKKITLEKMIEFIIE